VTGKYVAEKPTAERFADTTLLLWKVMTLIQRRPVNQLPDLGPRWAKLTVGNPIPISDRMADYKANRRQAIATVTADLQQALAALIVS
jgi:hypothetical protein